MMTVKLREDVPLTGHSPKNPPLHTLQPPDEVLDVAVSIVIRSRPEIKLKRRRWLSRVLFDPKIRFTRAFSIVAGAVILVLSSRTSPNTRSNQPSPAGQSIIDRDLVADQDSENRHG
jgi:hypothetical protein